MIFPLIIIPLTTIIFINLANWLFRARGTWSNIFVFGSSFRSMLKLITLLSLQISLAYGVYL